MPDDNDLLRDSTLPPSTAAFAASAAHSFRGRKLEPFSIMRQAAAQALGNKLLCGKARLDEPQPCPHCGGVQPPLTACPVCEGAGTICTGYDGMFADVAVLLHLCLSGEQQVLDAITSPRDGLAAALAWAESVPLILGSEPYQQACAVYSAILLDLRRSRFALVENKDPASPNG